MTEEELINGLKKRVIDSSLQDYIGVFSKAKIETDAINFFKTLGEEEKHIFFKIVRQIQIDTLADVLAFLDGTYWIEGQSEDLKLVSLGNPEEKLNGDLTDIFLNSIDGSN